MFEVLVLILLDMNLFLNQNLLISSFDVRQTLKTQLILAISLWLVRPQLVESMFMVHCLFKTQMHDVLIIKSASSGLRQFFAIENPLKMMDEKCFLFPLKSSFHYKDI